MQIDLSDLVREFSAPLPRRTFGEETIVGGYATPPAQVDDTIAGYVVPVSGRNIQQLPEGCRESSTHVLYTADAVATVAQQVPQRRAQEVFFEGFWHMVTGVADHSQQGGYAIAGLQRLGTVPVA